MNEVVTALKAEIARLPAKLREHPLAAAALTLAGKLDEGVGARDMAAVSRELRGTLADLRALEDKAPAEVDPADELAKLRVARISGAAIQDRSGRRSK